MNDPKQSIKYETQFGCELESNIKNIVKTESFNEVNEIKIKFEPEGHCPIDSQEAEWKIEPNLSIEKSEYEFQSTFLNWSVDKPDDSDEDEDDAEGDNGHDGNFDFDDNNGEKGCSYEDEKNPIISEPLIPDAIVKQKKKPRTRKAIRRERYFFFLKKRDFFDTYLLRICPYCGLEFESITAWDTHLNDMHNYKEMLKTHFSYSDDSKVSCNECKTILRKKLATLRTHLFLHLPYMNIFKCKVCCYARSKHILLVSHIERKHFDVVGEALTALNEVKALKSCVYCGKYVGRFNMLSTHIRLEHGETYEHKLFYVCPFCGDQFVNEKSHKKHLNDRHQFATLSGLSFEIIDERENNVCQKKYHCLKCSELLAGSTYFYNLIGHALKHLPYKCFKCRYCEYEHMSKSKVIQHTCKDLLIDIKKNPMLTVKTKPKINPRGPRNLDVINKLYVCPKCGENFEQQILWEAHLNKVHSFDKNESLNIEKTTAPDGKSEIIICTICKKIMSLSYNFFIKQHAFRHMPYKIYKCKLCQAPTSSLLACSCQDKSGKATFSTFSCVCPKCGKEYNKEFEWNRHMGAMHNLGKPSGLNFNKISYAETPNYKCLTCGEVIQESSPSSTDLLFKHATIKHMSFKCYKCSNCGELRDCKDSMMEHCNNCYNRTVLNITADNEVITKTKTIINRKLISSTKDAVKNKEDKSLRKNTQSDPLEIDTNNMENFSQTIMVINTNKSVSFKKYSKYITYGCPECNIPLETSEAWHTHISTEHDFFAEHRLNITPIPGYKSKKLCNECCETIDGSLLHMQRHKLSHMPYKSFTCSICIYRTKTLKPLYQHIRKTHLSPGKFKCILCDVIFSTFYERFEHTNLRHSGAELENVCKICSKRFNSFQYIEHMEKHDFNRIPYNFKLNIAAENEIENKTETIINRKRMLSTEDAVENEVAKKEINEPRRKISKKDTIVLETQSDCLKIAQTGMPLNSVLMLKYGKYISFACPECNIPLATSEAWRTHINTEHDFFAENRLNITPVPGVSGKAICDECCGTVHGSLLQKQRHKLTHMPYQAFTCNICVHRSKTLNVLFDHIRRKHLSPGKFQCIFCDVTFSTFYERFEHIKKQHSDAELENVCKICSKQYDNLKFIEHMKSHEFNRMYYECDYCDRKYTSNSERRKHYKKCHPAEFQRYHSPKQEQIKEEKEKKKTKK